MLSQESRKPDKMSPLLLYGTKSDIYGDICQKIDSSFATEIFERINRTIWYIKIVKYKSIRHSRTV